MAIDVTKLTDEELGRTTRNIFSLNSAGSTKGGSIILTSGAGGVSQVDPTDVGEPGDVIVNVGSSEVLRFNGDGTVFVRGSQVDDSQQGNSEVYFAFKRWISGLILRRVWVAMQVTEIDTYCADGMSGAYPGTASVMELIGVFTSEEKAVAACKESTDCVAPLELDAVAPREQTVLPGAYYPLARKELP